MTNDKINELVKRLEPLFLGYTAYENRLKNENGMEIVFRSDWNNKTKVSGLHAKHCHSIGCSFEKSPEKIFKDIRSRLMPEYHRDFFETKREKIERLEADEADSQKLKALASVIGGEICSHHGYRNAVGCDYVSTENTSIYQTYHGHYEFKISLSYIDAMTLVQNLKKLFVAD
jgi:hypothetical protein